MEVVPISWKPVMKSSLPTGQAGMTKTSHIGMIIMVRFSRFKIGTGIPICGTGQVMATEKQIKTR